MAATTKVYVVYTRMRGVHICAAYNKRHAIAATVSLFARDADWNPKEVCSWAVKEKRGGCDD